MRVPSSTNNPDRPAYVFYATDNDYARSALVAIHALQTFGIRPGIAIVLLHLGVSDSLIARFRDAGVVTKRVEPLRYVHSPYYRDVLVKLRIFELTAYDPVVFLDADALPLRSLDHLFDKPPALIAAPPAYWLPQPFVTSFLLVVRPSMAAWTRLARHFPSMRRRRVYDMDIINEEFRGEIEFLPAEYGCLNSEWETLGGRVHLGDPEETRTRAPVVHFSALGKPWSYTPAQVRRERPRAHPFFYELWERWWAYHDELELPDTGSGRLPKWGEAVSAWFRRAE